MSFVERWTLLCIKTRLSSRLCPELDGVEKREHEEEQSDTSERKIKEALPNSHSRRPAERSSPLTKRRVGSEVWHSQKLVRWYGTRCPHCTNSHLKTGIIQKANLTDWRNYVSVRLVSNYFMFSSSEVTWISHIKTNQGRKPLCFCPQCQVRACIKVWGQKEVCWGDTPVGSTKVKQARRRQTWPGAGPKQPADKPEGGGIGYLIMHYCYITKHGGDGMETGEHREANEYIYTRVIGDTGLR